MVMRQDSLIYPILVELSGCLCAEIKASGLPEPCQCGVVAGSEVVLDAAGCDDDGGGCQSGQAWVRLVDVFHTNDFPNVTTPGTYASQLAFTVDVGISRCFKVMDESGEGPTVSEHLGQVDLQLADMAAMRRAILCCLKLGGGKDRDVDLGVYTPLPIQGGVGGGFWRIVVGEG